MNKQSGQILLITVMLLATVLTVVLALFFKSTTETQITKLEEESQKALAAAEAGIEAALKEGNVILGSGNLSGFAGFTGGATVETAASSTFITPLLQKDEQYTFYLSTPAGAPNNPDFTNLIPAFNNNSLTLCSSSEMVALELTFIKAGSPPTIKRYLINPPGQTIIQNASPANNNGDCPVDENFPYRHRLSPQEVGNNNLLLIVRVINGSAKIGFKASAGNLPPQGKTIFSEAKSPTGVTKKIQLFQSYPQIPTDFFVTSF